MGSIQPRVGAPQGRLCRNGKLKHLYPKRPLFEAAGDTAFGCVWADVEAPSDNPSELLSNDIGIITGLVVIVVIVVIIRIVM